MTARDFALITLDAQNLPNWPAGLIRAGVPEEMDDRDRALGERIFVTVVKNLLLLQHLTAHYAKRRLDQIGPLLQKIIVIGLAQLRFLDRIPASAAVDEAVKQTRRFGQKSAAGFVNAVLRNATREPEVDLPARLALSHPAELYERLTELFGEERALAICEHNNSEPPTLVRLFSGVLPIALKSDDVSVRPHQDSGIFVVEGARRSVLADWSRNGVAQVQDATAAEVVSRLDIQPGQRVLDRCCGLGTKTRQIRQYLGENGFILAVDPSAARCGILRDLLQEQKIGNVEVLQSGSVSQLSPPLFDRILIDVPCSNSGVLARRAEARYSQTKERLASLIKLQDEILYDTAPWLKPGGLMVYSTCSLWPEENQDRMTAFLATHADYATVDSALTFPQGKDDPTAYRDGGYWCLLRRS